MKISRKKSGFSIFVVLILGFAFLPVIGCGGGSSSSGSPPAIVDPIIECEQMNLEPGNYSIASTGVRADGCFQNAFNELFIFDLENLQMTEALISSPGNSSTIPLEIPLSLYYPYLNDISVEIRLTNSNNCYFEVSGSLENYAFIGDDTCTMDLSLDGELSPVDPILPDDTSRTLDGFLEIHASNAQGCGLFLNPVGLSGSPLATNGGSCSTSVNISGEKSTDN